MDRGAATEQGFSNARSLLRDLIRPPAGTVQMLRCAACGYLAPLPTASLVQRFGAEAVTAVALRSVACSACRTRGRAEARLLRLCDPGCGRYRG